MDQPPKHQKHTKLAKPLWGESVPSVKGLVLAGGMSTRMGSDKGTVRYYGIPHRDHLIGLLQKFIPEVYLSCHPDRMPDDVRAVIADTFLDLGPYGGVLSAMRVDPNSAWLVVACDLPLIDENAIAQLLAERDPSKTATCFHDPSTGFPEPLLTIWEPRAYPVLLHNLSQGISCLRKSLINSETKHLVIERPEVLKNANTPEERDQLSKKILDARC